MRGGTKTKRYAAKFSESLASPRRSSRRSRLGKTSCSSARPRVRENPNVASDTGKFLRPRAIRAVQGLEDLNTGELHFAPSTPELDEEQGRVRRLLPALAHVLTQLTTDAGLRAAPGAPPVPPARRVTRAQIDVLSFMSSVLRAHSLLCVDLDMDVPPLLPLYVVLLTQRLGTDWARCE